MANSDFDALEAALIAERAALDAHDLAALEQALGVKRACVAALETACNSPTAGQREQLLRLRALNSDLEQRVNVALAATARRLAALGVNGELLYAADGRYDAPRPQGFVANA